MKSGLNIQRATSNTCIARALRSHSDSGIRYSSVRDEKKSSNEDTGLDGSVYYKIEENHTPPICDEIKTSDTQRSSTPDEKKSDIEIKPSTCRLQWLLHLLWIPILFGVAGEVSEFALGVKDNGDKIVSWNVIGALIFYCLQSLRLNGNYITQAATELNEARRTGTSPPGWPQFAADENRIKYAARIASILMNLYACFADSLCSYFYMLELELGVFAGIVMLISSAIFYLLTEALELDKNTLIFFKKLFSRQTHTNTDEHSPAFIELIKVINSYGEFLFAYATIVAALNIVSTTWLWVFLACGVSLALGDFSFGGKFSTQGFNRFTKGACEVVNDICHFRAPKIQPIAGFLCTLALAGYLAYIQFGLMVTQLYKIRPPFEVAPLAARIFKPILIDPMVYAVSGGTAVSQCIIYTSNLYDFFEWAKGRIQFWCSPAPRSDDSYQLLENNGPDIAMETLPSLPANIYRAQPRATLFQPDSHIVDIKSSKSAITSSKPGLALAS